MEETAKNKKKSADQRIDELTTQVNELATLVRMALDKESSNPDAKPETAKFKATTTPIESKVVESEVAPGVFVSTLTIDGSTWVKLPMAEQGEESVWLPLVNGGSTVIFTDPFTEYNNSSYLDKAGMRSEIPAYLQELFEQAEEAAAHHSCKDKVRHNSKCGRCSDRPSDEGCGDSKMRRVSLAELPADVRKLISILMS